MSTRFALSVCLAGLLCPLAQAADQDFNQVAIGSSASALLSFQFSSPALPVTAQLAYSSDFSASSASCSGAGTVSCTVSVTFTPSQPGLRTNALRLIDNNANVLTTMLLHGVGMAANTTLGPGLISTFAGTGAFSSSGDGGPAASANFENPERITIDTAGNLYVTDSVSCTVRKISASSTTISTVAGSGLCGFSGDGNAAVSAKLQAPIGIAVDGAGNLYIADSLNNRIRRVDAYTHVITTVAGGGTVFGDGGQATQAQLSSPSDVVVDAHGALYIADTGNNRIRYVNTSGVISTIAGGGTPQGGSDGLGDGGASSNSQLSRPTALALDASGNLYISDSSDNLVREISSGIITVLAGTGAPHFSGDYGPAVNASLSDPGALSADAAGDVFIVDTGNAVVREVLATGTILTVAGTPSQTGYTGDGGFATSAKLNGPSGVIIGAGNAYIVDQGNRVVRAVSGTVSSFSFPSTAVGQLSNPETLFLSNSGNEPLTLASLSLNGPFVQQSSGMLDCVQSLSVQSGGACEASVVFSPSQTGAASGSLVFSVGSSNSQTITLSGTGTSGSGTGPTVSPTSLKFGSIQAGTTSAAQRVTLSYSGSASLNLAIVVGGTNTTDFAVDSSTTTCPAVLPASITCSIGITFTPSVAGQRTATLNLGESGSNGSYAQSVFLVGSGTTVSPSFNPSALNFGTATAASSSLQQTVLLTNPGNAAQSIAGIVLSGENDFSIASTTCGGSLAGNGSCNFVITFAPAVTGLRSAVLTVTLSNGVNVQLPISGTGATFTPPVFSPTSYDFGSQIVGVSVQQTVTLSNPGSATLTIGSPVLSGAADFSVVSNTCTSSLAANASCDVVIQFAPQTVVSESATVSVTVTGGSPLQMTFTGRGISATIPQFSPSSLNFGSQPPNGLPITLTATVSNASTTAVSIGTPTVSGSSAFSVAGTTCTSTLQANTSCTVTVQFVATSAGSTSATLNVSVPGGNAQLSLAGTGSSGSGTPLQFVPITPCRVADTRNPTGPFGGPSLSSGGTRTFDIPQSACNIPSNAAAFALNVTVVPRGPLGYITMWPAGAGRPLASVLNSLDGRIKANAVIIPAGDNGGVSIFATDATDIVLDINGYFVPAGTPSALEFYPLTPCRIADTREASGPLGGPSLSAGIARDLPILQSSCGIPSNARAYSLNFTAVPHTTLGYLAVWPSGQGQPLVSTLNAFTGAITANAAIVPAGTNGDINVFVTNNSDLVIDVNGYFAAPATGGLSLYNVTPCRVLDTREIGNGSPLNGQMAWAVLNTCSLPSNAQAVVFNATVVPWASLGYLSLWPDGKPRPLVSTLNAFDQSITSNMAIVPVTDGSVDLFTAGASQVILDTSGFFAP